MLKKIVAATGGPASLADAKKHCHANDFDDDNEVLQIYLDAATQFVSERCSLILAPTTYLLERGDWWSGSLCIPLSPVRDVVSIKYSDEFNVEQTVSEDLYQWRRTSDGVTIEFLSAFTYPTVIYDRCDAVRIELLAGFDVPGETGAGDDPELGADPRARQAVLLLTSHWYENREAVSKDNFGTVPLAAESLMGQLRIYR